MAAPKLQNLQTFSDLLSEYAPSPAELELIADLKLVVITRTTSAGGNTVINKLLETDEYEFAVSDTTRPPRVNNGVLEQNGVEYFFLSENEMIDGLSNSAYLEAALIHKQQVSGTSFRELRKLHSEGKHAVIEADYQGAEKIHQVKPDSLNIFILPPSYEEWMNRLKNRGDMSQDEILHRLQSAEKELQHAIDNDFYKLVVNDDLDEAVAVVRHITEDNEYSEATHEKNKTLAWELLNNLKEVLSS